MKRILGLDLGTNSIGWAVVKSENVEGNDVLTGIEGAGSRIIPMDAAQLGDFDKGNTQSQTKERTHFRGVRRIRERSLLRRERLHRVLDVMGFLPQHYAEAIDRYGKFVGHEEPKLAWAKDESGKMKFLFEDSFREMIAEFRTANPDFLSEGGKVPYDWTIYYLRQKALHQAISKEELAWILLNFNQKRGYYQLRGEDEEEANPKKQSIYCALQVLSVEDSGEKKGKDTWYNVHLEGGLVYRRTSTMPLDWVGKTKEFIITTDLDDNGNPKVDKDGNVKRSLRLPKEDDWTLLKKKTEYDISTLQLTVGQYIFAALLNNPKGKIRGKLVRTIERKYYKDELIAILRSQQRFIPELNDNELYSRCINELYGSNESYRKSIASRDFVYLFVDNILFYQRPLKSKKSLIDNCPLESNYCHVQNGGVQKAPIKCVAKSAPLFQEFRLWQFLSNLRIYQREKEVNGKLMTDVDVTGEFITTQEDYERLFNFLNEREKITQDTLLQKFFNVKKPKEKDAKLPYRWNYVEDREYPANKTRGEILAFLSKANIPADFLTAETENSLWHLLYSIDDKQELHKALETFATRHGLEKTFVEVFAKFPPFKKEYGAFSAKAIKRLLPLMRMGSRWNEKDIDAATRQRIDKIIDGEYDETIRDRVREKAIHLTDIRQFSGLPLWLASYIVYDRHSEASETSRWKSPDDISRFLQEFKQHSMRNPVVEQVVTETLRTVRDIWKQYGNIDEVHVELGREMKNPADKRRKMTERALENENTNLRIKAILMELMNPDSEVENVRPYSPSQQELLRIYEEGVLGSERELPDFVEETLAKFRQSDSSKRPSHAEVIRYKCWLEQKYRSPYTGEPISLARLFTPDYEIEHVIPQSRFFDDSMQNKVICESEVNKLKGNLLGYEFIEKHHGEKVTLTGGKVVTVFDVPAYERFVKETYASNPSKMRNLMLDDIPEKFIERQMNDTRYISSYVKTLLSNLVRSEGEQEAVSKNVIACTGGVTDRLKHDWGVTEVWNHIILPRFERLNDITGTQDFTAKSANGHTIPAMPLELQRGFNKKRIDHRHHAMDAIVIACANRNIVNYLNNESARRGAAISRYDLQRILCHKVKDEDDSRWVVDMPWESFPADVKATLENMVVSFKQNLRVINKATNHYQVIEDGKKVVKTQTKGDNWAIRRSMHKDTVFGEVNLKRIKEVGVNEAFKNPDRIVDKELKAKMLAMKQLSFDLKRVKKYFEEEKDAWQDVNLKKIPIYYFTKETIDRFFATRKPLDESFDESKIKNHVTDTGIQKILLHHLAANDNDPKLAFSPEGIEEMNRNIVALNDGKSHQPIYKVRWYEKSDKFAVGTAGCKAKQFFEADKGTNLFFAIYDKEYLSEQGTLARTRSYASVPLNEVIERQKKGLPSAPENEDGMQATYVLSPNDLVYVPRQGEDVVDASHIDRGRIYKMVSSSGNQVFFVHSNTANVIVNKVEFSAMNKMERAITGEMIKEICIPIEVDRLGNIQLKRS